MLFCILSQLREAYTTKLMFAVGIGIENLQSPRSATSRTGRPEVRLTGFGRATHA